MCFWPNLSHKSVQRNPRPMFVFSEIDVEKHFELFWVCFGSIHCWTICMRCSILVQVDVFIISLHWFIVNKKEIRATMT